MRLPTPLSKKMSLATFLAPCGGRLEKLRERAYYPRSCLFATPCVALSLQSENVRFVQSRNVRVHRWPRGQCQRRGHSPASKTTGGSFGGVGHPLLRAKQPQNFGEHVHRGTGASHDRG